MNITKMNAFQTYKLEKVVTYNKAKQRTLIYGWTS